MRVGNYIAFLLFLLFVGTAFKTGESTHRAHTSLSVSLSHQAFDQDDNWLIRPTVEISKPRIKVRYRASEIRFDLCGIPEFSFIRVFYDQPEFCDRFSFLSLYFQRYIHLRGPPAYYFC